MKILLCIFLFIELLKVTALFKCEGMFFLTVYFFFTLFVTFGLKIKETLTQMGLLNCPVTFFPFMPENEQIEGDYIKCKIALVHMNKTSYHF